MNSLDASNSIGIDLGILNYSHTSDGKTVDWLDFDDRYECLQREQHKLSQKEKPSNNYAKQRREVAKVKRHTKRKVLDYQHKTTTWLVREYDAVLLEYRAALYGTHVVQAEARGITKECASCGVEVAKPICVREHSCPSCRFETDRDANTAMNVLKGGFAALGLGWPENTPVETVTATDTTHFESVSASHVVETGRPGVVRKTASSVMTRDGVSRTT